MRACASGLAFAWNHIPPRTRWLEKVRVEKGTTQCPHGKLLFYRASPLVCCFFVCLFVVVFLLLKVCFFLFVCFRFS